MRSINDTTHSLSPTDSPQSLQPEMLSSTTPSPIPKRAILSGWTDVDLLCVLDHFNRDFAMTINAILRHDETGQPPEDLIRLLREGEIGPQPQHVRNSSGFSLPSFPYTGSSDRLVPLGGSVSIGTMAQPVRCYSHPSTSFPPPSSTLSRLEGVHPPHNNSAFRHPDFESCTAVAVPRRRTRQDRGLDFSRNTHEMSSFQDHTEQETVKSAISHLLDLDVHRTLSRREKYENEILLQLLSERRHKQPATSVSKPKTQKHLQGPSSRDIDMLNLQAAIEASWKETRNTSENNVEDDAFSHAVIASKKSFNEEFEQGEVRKELEGKMIKAALVESLSDPVKKTEEELITEAMAESLAEPVKKSEEQLIEEAMQISLSDPVKKTEEELITEAMTESLAEPVKKSEEQLIEEVMKMSQRDPTKKTEEEFVKEAIWQSLPQTMPNDEDRVEALTRQPFRCLSESVAKMPAEASVPTSFRLFSNEDEEDTKLECSILMNHDDSLASALYSSVTNSACLDCKMPAQVQTETQVSDNDVTASSGSNTEEV